MAEFEVEGSEILLGDVDDGFPAMEAILDQDLKVLGQPQASQHVSQVGHGWAGPSSEGHDVGGMRGGGSAMYSATR